MQWNVGVCIQNRRNTYERFFKPISTLPHARLSWNLRRKYGIRFFQNKSFILFLSRQFKGTYILEFFLHKPIFSIGFQQKTYDSFWSNFGKRSWDMAVHSRYFFVSWSQDSGGGGCKNYKFKLHFNKFSKKLTFFLGHTHFPPQSFDISKLHMGCRFSHKDRVQDIDYFHL